MYQVHNIYFRFPQLAWRRTFKNLLHLKQFTLANDNANLVEQNLDEEKMENKVNKNGSTKKAAKKIIPPQKPAVGKRCRSAG